MPKPKKEVEKGLAELGDLADRLSSVADELSVSELDALLESAGCDVSQMDARLHAVVVSLTDRLQDAKRTPPNYLLKLSEQTAPLEQKARLTPKLAIAEVVDFLKGLVPSGALPQDIVLAAAYRKNDPDQELPESDKEILGQLEAELKDRVKQQG